MRSCWTLAAILVLLVGMGYGCGGSASVVTIALWDVPVSVDRRQPAAAEAFLLEAAADLARRTVVLFWPGGERHYRLDELGVVLDARGMALDAAAIALGKRLPAGRLVVPARARVDENALEVALKPLRAALDQAPVPAELRVVGGTVQVVPDVAGLRIDEVELARSLRAGLAEGPGATGDLQAASAAASTRVLRLQVFTRPTRAAVTAASLEALGIKRRIASFTTAYDASVPRGENVERAARALDGVIVRPHGVFSYNTTVGPVNASYGWQQAWVIAGGRLVPGVGGGICQAATTLYGAALRAGLTILERHPHALPVSYIEPSLDAAVAPGWQDLKLRNDRETGVLFQTRSEGGRVTVAIYGDAPAGEEIQIQSQATAVPFPTEVVPDPDLPPGQEVVEVEGYPGYRSTAFRLVYRNGALVSQEWLSQDEYPPIKRVIRRGTAARPAG